MNDTLLRYIFQLEFFLYLNQTQNVHFPIRHVLHHLLSYLATLEAESALRRSRVEAELAASRTATEIVLRRSRLESADAYVEKVNKDQALRRSRAEAHLAEEAAYERRGRLEEELKEEQYLRETALKRSRV